jgi:two-component sensor histidine kinase
MATRQTTLLERQRVLAEFGAFALEGEDANAILGEACRLVGRALGTDLAKVMEILPGGETMLVRAGVGWKPGIVGRTTIAATADTPEALTLAEGAVISPNIETEARFAYHAFLKEHGVKAFVNVVILSGTGRAPFGVLQVDSRSPREFDVSDVEFLRTYANLIGAAVGRLRVVEELRTALGDKELLINELNHRVKNTLATVQSIALQSLRNVATLDQAKAAIEGRLLALARAHDLLTRENWEPANLHDIVAQAIGAFRALGENRINVNGPDVAVPPRTALVLAMMLQELATNAVKYGALSNDAGEVRLGWELSGPGGAHRLVLRWEESGGPPVAAPTRRGFGTRLIERGLADQPGGDVRIEFAPGGVVCIFEHPLRVSASGNVMDPSKRA